MASKTILTCDHCNSETEKLYPMYLTVVLNFDGRRPSITREVCDDCLSEFGFENKSDTHYISNFVSVEKNIFSMAKKFFAKR